MRQQQQIKSVLLLNLMENETCNNLCNAGGVKVSGKFIRIFRKNKSQNFRNIFRIFLKKKKVQIFARLPPITLAHHSQVPRLCKASDIGVKMCIKQERWAAKQENQFNVIYISYFLLWLWFEGSQRVKQKGREREKRNRECLFDNNNVIIENCMLFCAKKFIFVLYMPREKWKEDWTWEQNYAKHQLSLHIGFQSSDFNATLCLWCNSVKNKTKCWKGKEFCHSDESLQHAINGKLYAIINLTIKELLWNHKKAFIINKTFCLQHLFFGSWKFAYRSSQKKVLFCIFPFFRLTSNRYRRFFQSP